VDDLLRGQAGAAFGGLPWRMHNGWWGTKPAHF
jgi:hypothetical protein